ncbi:MAG TPA: heavy-metal-associated domain-containing protein [Bacteroidales bacterium]|nr:heavy-metal-associated domain-containing protein [Bacteroidales bacterium]
MKHVMLMSIVLAFLVTACSGPSANKAKKEASKEALINPDNVIRADMDITGMHCTDCENTIKSGISELNGVVDVTADYQAGITVVDFDSALTSIAEITKVIENRGYAVDGSRLRQITEVKPD